MPEEETERQRSLRRLIKGRAKRDRAQRDGPLRVLVLTVQTGPDTYTRSIRRLGDKAPLAVQQLFVVPGRRPPAEGHYLVAGDKARRLVLAAKSGA